MITALAFVIGFIIGTVASVVALAWMSGHVIAKTLSELGYTKAGTANSKDQSKSA